MKILSAFLTFMFCGIVNVWASQTTGINGLPSTLAVGDTVIVYASNGTMPYTWNSNNAGVVVVQLDSIQAKVIVLTAVPNVTISATDASSITGIQVISTYDFKTRIGNSTFIDGDTVEIPVFYSSHTALFDLLSADISLPYDTTVFKFIGFNKTGTLTNPMTVIFNQVYDTIKLGIAATFPAGPTSEQIFLKLRFVSKDSVITSTSRSLHFTRFHVNEQIEGAFVDGIVTVDPIPNYVPVFIISAPDTIINEGDLYTFTVLATDANNQTVHYFLTTNSAPVNEASIDSITGQFSFSPSYLSANVYAFVISADDGHGMTSINPFTITVNNVNLSPLITTGIPDTMYVAEGQNFFLDIDATDGDVEPLKYLIINPPIGMTIDSLTGIVNWNPNFTQSGVYNPTFKVKDSLEAFDSRYVVLIVLNVNRIPVFISILQDTIIAEDQLLSFNYAASDADLDSLTFLLLTPISGMSVSAAGLLQWTPTYVQAGIETVVVRVSDGFDIVRDTAIVIVVNTNRSPAFTSVLHDTSMARFDTLRFDYTGNDPDNDSSTFILSINPAGATLTADGHFEWIPPANASGNFVFVVHYKELQDSTSFAKDSVIIRVYRFGDVSGNGTISSFDAGLILRDQVAAIELTPVQIQVGNVSGDSTISSADASFILQYVVGLINTFPGGLGKHVRAEAVLSAFSFRIVPSQTEGDYDLFVSVNKPSQVYGITMSLGFDSAIVTAKTMKQTVLSDSMMMSFFFPNGRANIALAGTKPLNTSGDIARFTFTLKDKNVSRNSVLFTMKKFILNETDFTGDISGITLDVKDAAAMPVSYLMEQNYPNPFNPATSINYQLPKDGRVTVVIYNMLGQEVKSLVSAEQSAGYYSVSWNGTDNNNSAVSSGVYLYKIIAQSQGKNVFVNTKKMLLLK